MLHKIMQGLARAVVVVLGKSTSNKSNIIDHTNAMKRWSDGWKRSRVTPPEWPSNSNKPRKPMATSVAAETVAPRKPAPVSRHLRRQLISAHARAVFQHRTAPCSLLVTEE